MSGEPILLQLCVVPCYALTIHKTQALSIPYLVRGCLEEIFAQGQAYVLVSRCTDPANFHLVGVPPKDLLNDVVAAWTAAGLNVEECFRKAVSVTNEWIYDSQQGLQQKRLSERMVPIKHRTLAETLDPQPRASVVFRRLLDWLDRVDEASVTGAPRPPFQTLDGDAIFPDQEELWWLTELQRKPDDDAQGDEDGPPSDVDDEAPAPDAPTTDEDPLSEPEPADEHVLASVGAHTPSCGWRVV